MWINRIGFLVVCQLVVLFGLNISVSEITYSPPVLLEHRRDTASNNPINYQNNELPGLLIERNAKIVFQCNGGICKKLIGEKKPIRLTDNGTYPRWSPDGLWIAFVRGNAIMRMNSKGKNIEVLARANAPRAVAWTLDGRVIFTDRKVIKAVHLDTLIVETVFKGPEFFEIDMVCLPKENGDILAATVKRNFSYNVKTFNLKTGKKRAVAKGCSASLSPDGQQVTVLTHNHKQLDMYWVPSGVKMGHINAPPGFKFDNHFWSTGKNWIVSNSEGKQANIFVHHVPTNRVWQVTFKDDCNRPDLYIASD